MNECMYVCMHVCMYVCMYVHVYLPSHNKESISKSMTNYKNKGILHIIRPKSSPHCIHKQ